MAIRGNRKLIKHNNAIYITPSLMPRYCGHIPGNKYLYGNTFGNATIKNVQDILQHKPVYPSGSEPSPNPQHPLLDARQCGLRPPGDARDLRTGENGTGLCQKHRENYKDKTGTRQQVTYFIIPVNEINKFPQKQQSGYRWLACGGRAGPRHKQHKQLLRAPDL
uniref:Ciliary microtubule inner protein 2C n=1 Tax=Esox lucius TaxID=8010 RepID=A0AAY5K5M8_ESOLU